MSDRNQIILRIKNIVEGMQDIERLISEIDNLGGESKSVAEESAALNREFEKLQKQQSTIDQLNKLNNTIEKTGDDLAKAEEKAATLGNTIASATRPTKTLTREYERAQARVSRLKEAQASQTETLKRYTNRAKAAGVDTTRLTAEQVRLSGASADLKDKTDRLANRLTDSRDGYREAANKAKQLNNELDETARKSDGASRGLSLLKRAFAGISAALAARFFTETNQRLESIGLGFETVAGSSAAAAEEMEYVERVADRMGTSVLASADAYLSLTAAAKGTALEGQQTRGIYEAVSLAMGKLGKSAVDTEGALKAIEQMMSKGKVQAEELRGQLGERLPGAFNLAAAAMGKTTAELDKMLESGEVTADVLLPKLTEQLNRLYDDGQKIETFAAGWNRLKNNFVGLSGQLDESSGAMDSMGQVMSDLGEYIKEMIRGVKDSSEEWKGFVDFLASSTAVAFGSIKAVWNGAQIAFKSLVLVINEGIQKINEGMALITFGDISEQFSQAAREIAEENRKMRLSIGEDVQDMVDAGERIVSVFTKEKEAAKETAQAVQHAGDVSRETSVDLGALSQSLKEAGIDAKSLGRTISDHAVKQIAALGVTSKDTSLKGAKLVDFFTKLAATADSPIVLSSAIGILKDKLAAGLITQEEYNAALAVLENRYKELSAASTDAARGAADFTNTLDQQGRAVDKTASSVEKLGKSSEQQAGSTKKASGSVEILTGVMKAARAEMAGLGEAASAAFERLVPIINRAGGSMRNFSTATGQGTGEVQALEGQIEELNRKLDDLDDAHQQATKGAAEWMVSVSKAATTVKKEFLEQKLAATQLANRLGSLNGASKEQLDSLERTVNGYNLLDDTDLSGIRSEISRLRAEQEALNDSISSTLHNLQDEFDRLSGNEANIQIREYRRQLAELQEQLEEARRSGNTAAANDALQAINLLQRVHAERMKQIKEQRQAEGRSGDFSGAIPSGPRTTAQPLPIIGGGGGSAGGPGGALKPAEVVEVRFESPSGDSVSGVFPAGSQSDLLRVLEESGGRTA